MNQTAQITLIIVVGMIHLLKPFEPLNEDSKSCHRQVAVLTASLTKGSQVISRQQLRINLCKDQNAVDF